MEYRPSGVGEWSRSSNRTGVTLGQTGSLPGDRPPHLNVYLPPVHPVEAVFVAWNPPSPFARFWTTAQPDNLRTEIHGALCHIGRATAPEPDCDFLDEFRGAETYSPIRGGCSKLRPSESE
jgi:hypothetical protein